MHSGVFYIALSRVLPVLLVAVAVAEAAAGRRPPPRRCTCVMAGTSWVLMLFPATPKLGPIYRDITHYVPLDFPLLLVVPAAALDLTWRRVRDRSAWVAAIALGTAFVTLVAVQWPFANFLIEHGRNWFLHADNFVYWQRPETEHFNFEFDEAGPGAPSLVSRLAWALFFAVIASGIGRGWGRWMTRVQR